MSENRIERVSAARGEYPAQASSGPLALPAWVSLALGLVSAAAGALALVVPPPFGGALGIAAFIAASLVGGVAAPPQWVAGRPVVQGGAVAVAGGAAVALQSVAAAVPESSPWWLRLGTQVGAMAAAWLAGRAAPQLGRVS